MKFNSAALSLLVGVCASPRSVTADFDCTTDMCACPKLATESCPDLSPAYATGISQSTCCFYGDNVVVSNMVASDTETSFTYDGEDYVCSQLPACPAAPTTVAATTPSRLDTPSLPPTDTAGFETLIQAPNVFHNFQSSTCDEVEYTGSCTLTDGIMGCKVGGEPGSCDCMVVRPSTEQILNLLGDWSCDGAPENTSTTTTTTTTNSSEECYVNGEKVPCDQKDTIADQAYADAVAKSGAMGAATLTFAALVASAAVVSVL